MSLCRCFGWIRWMIRVIEATNCLLLYLIWSPAKPYEMLWQMTASLAAEKNANSWSYSFGDQKAGMSSTGLKSSRLYTWSIWSLWREGTFFSRYSTSSGCLLPWLMAPSSFFQAYHSKLFPSSPKPSPKLFCLWSLLHSSYKDLCDYTGPTK